MYTLYFSTNQEIFPLTVASYFSVKEFAIESLFLETADSSDVFAIPLVFLLVKLGD